MIVWQTGLLSVALFCGASALAFAQVGGVSGALNSDNGAMSGGAINRVNGINANGTPRQQDPGASMTNGAGSAAMTPNITGATISGAGNVGLDLPETIPPTVIIHGTLSPN